MRMHIILSTQLPQAPHRRKTWTDELVHVQRYLAETYYRRQAKRPRISRAFALYSSVVLSTAKFPERFE